MSPNNPYSRAIDGRLATDDRGTLSDRATGDGYRAVDDQVTDSPVLVAQTDDSDDSQNGEQAQYRVQSRNCSPADSAKNTVCILEYVNRAKAQLHLSGTNETYFDIDLRLEVSGG